MFKSIFLFKLSQAIFELPYPFPGQLTERIPLDIVDNEFRHTFSCIFLTLQKKSSLLELGLARKGHPYAKEIGPLACFLQAKKKSQLLSGEAPHRIGFRAKCAPERRSN
jgi:hypothetical protein